MGNDACGVPDLSADGAKRMITMAIAATATTTGAITTPALSCRLVYRKAGSVEVIARGPISRTAVEVRTRLADHEFWRLVSVVSAVNALTRALPDQSSGNCFCSEISKHPLVGRYGSTLAVCLQCTCWGNHHNV